MDHQRFDDIARHLSIARSRRQVAKLLVGVAAGGSLATLGLRDAAAGRGVRNINQCLRNDLEGCRIRGSNPPRFICVDTTTSNNHCGKCDNECQDGSTCSDGQCVCPNSAETYCGGKCVNTQTNANHCNGCGKECPVQTCTNGQCLQNVCCAGICVRPGTIC